MDEDATKTTDPLLAAAWERERAALRAMGVDDGVDADVVTEVKKWVGLVIEVRNILGARDGEDIRTAARRCVRRGS